MAKKKAKAVASGQSEPAPLTHTCQTLGEKFIKLGEALKNPDTTVRQLVNLSMDCGLLIRFSYRKDGE